MEVFGNHLIITILIIFSFTMVITFSLAVSSRHVYPIMPFMSYTGDRPVESCIFSLGLNVVAVLFAGICVVRYNQVRCCCLEDNELPHSNSILLVNRNSILWGLASAVGLSITGSFQELNAVTIHRTGALICSYCGFIYFWHQAVISDITIGKLNSRQVSLLRTILCFVSTSIHIIGPILIGLLDFFYPRCHEDTLLWKFGEEGWHLHTSCSFLEWIIFFINLTYVGSFYKEFKYIKICKDEIIFTQFERNLHENRKDTFFYRKYK